jgi:hypothetical protein
MRPNIILGEKVNFVQNEYMGKIIKTQCGKIIKLNEACARRKNMLIQ